MHKSWWVPWECKPDYPLQVEGLLSYAEGAKTSEQFIDLLSALDYGRPGNLFHF